jgi:hypothetical protein
VSSEDWKYFVAVFGFKLNRDPSLIDHFAEHYHKASLASLVNLANVWASVFLSISSVLDNCERSEHLWLKGERPGQIDTKCCPAKP